ncbi:MAG: to elongator complex protein ELP3 [Parcubacteria group bacterium Gr01-1014_18]|nr:MAG: to elongator complex protein ELP3 [Parcubacteria group bacterium Greene0416_36]TSC79863.1 MAG: to elongator complex protein ELP3 [Parcubacteria group bacterium Gr01-1014_18]TSC98295.1 MAG: to elongator complex protein ELP3 [Parcubacteria group bacterium Greene1014_20]TSD06664.1 MAG: to elongator complex protein ELP3 [Parcubacteria group bacterium Greene0714_2]
MLPLPDFQQLIRDLNQNLPLNQNGLINDLRKWMGPYKMNLPRKSEIWKVYKSMVDSGAIQGNPELENLLRKRAIRTISGVAPITVMTAPLSCPKNCLYCPTERNMPKSYLSNQPAAMRAVLSDFDPGAQTSSRLKALHQNGHSTDKIEIIINGGTWSAHPRAYQTWYIKKIFEACNHYDVTKVIGEGIAESGEAKNIIRKKLITGHKIEERLQSEDDSVLIPKLLEEQKINETGQNRVIGITLETRPDTISAEELARMRMLGATKVEIGVQTLYQDIADLNRREQCVQDVKDATKLLKDAGFKVAFHMMPAMYGSTPERDIEMFRTLFADPDLKPDFLKIYPCLVVKDSDLYEIFKKGDFKPYSTKTLTDVIIAAKQFVPRYCRISRLHRDIPTESIEGGCTVTNLREIIQKELKKRGLVCQCIRCREPKKLMAKEDEVKLSVQEIAVNDTKEFFLSYESLDEKTIYAFCRLRLPSPTNSGVVRAIPELAGAALIRELHTYGKLIPIGDKNNTESAQHMGFGRRLMAEAEKIAREHGITKMAVIAGIGVREYYAKLGYELEGTYMVKKIRS